MINIEEYLAEEGIVDFSEINPEDLINNNLGSEYHDEFESIMQKYARNNTPENIIEYYSFSHKHPTLRNAFDGLLYQRNIATVPVVNSYIWQAESVLEIGCGDGLKTTFYALNNPKIKYLATDINEVSLSVAERRAKKYGCSNISFAVANSCNLPFEDKFDVVLAEYVLHETMTPYGDSYFKQKLGQISKVLERRSIVVLSPYDFESLKQDLIIDGSMVGLDFVESLKIPSIKFSKIHEDLVMISKPNKFV